MLRRIGCSGLAVLLLLTSMGAIPPLGGATSPVAEAATNGLIAFQSNRDHINDPLHFAQFEIYVMRYDGSGQTRLTFTGGSTPVWSPDGRKIAFSKPSEGGTEIWTMNADGSSAVQLTSGPEAHDSFPTWSSDGRKLAFSRFTHDVVCNDGLCSTDNWEIWTMNADGTGLMNVTRNTAEDIEPAWQPGASRIVFRSNRDGSPKLYIMNADGSGVTNLSGNAPQTLDDSPKWSPDGKTIAFSSGRATLFFGSDLYTMRADGSGLARLTTTNVNEMPAWSPDGRQLAFTSTRDFNAEIYRMRIDGSGATRLTNNAPPGNTLPEDFFPDWQPVLAEPVTCGTTISGAHGTLIVQPEGTTCVRDAQITGAVLGRPGARLFIDHSTISGAVMAEAPAFFALCGSTVTGAVSVSGATGEVLIGAPDEVCSGNSLGGAVLLHQNRGVTAGANHIGGALVCSANASEPTNDGRVNTVTGARTGQCAGV